MSVFFPSFDVLVLLKFHQIKSHCVYIHLFKENVDILESLNDYQWFTHSVNLSNSLRNSWLNTGVFIEERDSEYFCIPEHV